MLPKRTTRFFPPVQTGTGMTATPPRRCFSCTAATHIDFTHTIIGGGIIGLSIAHHLSLRPGTSTLLLERHPALGTETSSRNSEVIHAGLYYGRGTLKTAMCLRGRALLYGFCARHGVPHRRTGKWIVAQTDAQRAELERVFGHARGLGIPVRWLPRGEVERRGEGIRADGGALESPATGIVDAHALMGALEGLLRDDGRRLTLGLSARVVGVRSLSGSGWEVDVRDEGGGGGGGDDGADGDGTVTVTSETIINAAGLGAVDIHNMIVPAARRKRLYLAKGSYFAYAAPRPAISRLVYPAPDPGAAGLGTHLTLDMAGRLRFGPDVEWVDDPADLAVTDKRLAEAVREIKTYLPGVDETCLVPDYAGMRPKLTYGGAGQMGDNFNDFVIRLEDGYDGWVNCLGIESPGLTSCLAIGERVSQLLYGP